MNIFSKKEKKDNENKIVHIPVCRKCGVILTDENWYASYKKKYDYVCKKCNCEYTKKWQQNNRDKCNQLQNESNHRLINDVIDAYGGKCACCGETRKEYLSIDHINGDGNKHKREIGVKDSREFYRWLKKNNYPEEFQVLCFNCNCGKRNYSACPHNEEVFEKEFEAKLKESRFVRYRWDLRMNIIEGYGGKCELCGEDNPYFLTLDHINGDGAEERKILGGQLAVYRKLRDSNYPKDNYRLLCYNCNCALGFNRITEEEILQQINTKNKEKNRSGFILKNNLRKKY